MDDKIICKSQAIQASMEKPYVCILVESPPPQLDPVSLEVVLAKSRDEAKKFFRTLSVVCLIVPQTFKNTNIAPFIEWFRNHFPNVLIILYGKELVKDELRLQKNSNLILIPSNHLEHVIEVVERALKERAFTLDLEAVWPEVANYSPIWVRKILRYLLENENFLRIKSVREVAYHFGVTEAYLDSTFNRASPLSLKQLLLALRLSKAAYLKDTTTLPTKFIALKCGFADIAHLCHVARKYFGMPISTFLTSLSWREVIPLVIETLQRKALNQ